MIFSFKATAKEASKKDLLLRKSAAAGIANRGTFPLWIPCSSNNSSFVRSY